MFYLLRPVHYIEVDMDDDEEAWRNILRDSGE